MRDQVPGCTSYEIITCLGYATALSYSLLNRGSIQAPLSDTARRAALKLMPMRIG
jgi:hypothetical protein